MDFDETFNNCSTLAAEIIPARFSANCPSAPPVDKNPDSAGGS
jgi:hypothetical protein